MNASERKIEILKLLKEGSMTLDELAKKFNVSVMTIRRDLKKFEDQDVILISQGTVYLNKSVGSEESYILKKDKMIAEKIRIAQKAIEYINDGEVVYIDCGTTCAQIAEELAKSNKKITVMTSSILVVNALFMADNIDLYMLPGKYREKSIGFIGDLTIDFVRKFYFDIRNFLNIAELIDENYVVYAENGEDGLFRLKLFCVNPAVNLGGYLKKGRSAVFFSATLLPMSYYRKLLSCRQDDYGIYVESPFSQKNRCILNAGDVSSLYSRRGYEEYHKIAEYIARTVWQRQGNYMVFFPSYKMLEEVYAVYEEEFSVNWVKCICQNSSMKEQEREEFLQEFEQDQESLVAFCIMGGIFSEGIDLLGEKLIGAILVGTGLPQLGNEREILRSFYTENGENGFDYAYRYPGMNKVLQAAGRVIRTREDHGVILLLDERFRQREYSNLFPVEWNDRKTCILSNVEAQLQKFWESIPDKISHKL